MVRALIRSLQDKSTKSRLAIRYSPSTRSCEPHHEPATAFLAQLHHQFRAPAPGAAHGVLRLVLELDGEVVARVRSRESSSCSWHREADRAEDLLCRRPLFDRLRLRCADCRSTPCFSRPKTARHRGAAPLPVDPRALLPKDWAARRKHPPTSPTQADGCWRADGWGFEEREKLMVFYALSGSRMHGLFPNCGVTPRTCRQN